MIEGKFLRSPYAHARIFSIDTHKAETFPGLFAVLTSKDFTDVSPYVGKGKDLTAGKRDIPHFPLSP